MIQSDIYAVLQWWMTILLIGSVFLPISCIVFNKFFDKGYLFSKPLGIALTSYTIFTLGVLHIAPFTRILSFFTLFLLATGFNLIFLRKSNFLNLLKNNWKVFIFEELLFLSALFFWAYIHSFNPDIHGLEKFMDFGFLNSILRSKYFPPKDMWLTPFPINYYYFGHLATAVLTRLSGIPAKITFNLMLSTIFALCLTESFSLGANLFGLTSGGKKIKLIASGILTAALVTLAGNLHIVYGFFKPYDAENPVPFWKLKFLPYTFPNSYWYPNATRFIYHTIHEFPVYSWVVADLHGHVLDIPFVLLTIALLVSFFVKDKHNALKQQLPSLLLIGFMLSVMYMTNAWDGGIYLLLTGLALLYIYSRSFSRLFATGAIVFISMIVFSMPYSYFFKPFASGIGVLCAPDLLTKIGKIGPLLFEKNHCQHSYWWQLLMLYGFFYFFVLCFGVFASRTKKLLKPDIFVFLLIILSTFIIILPEFIYLKDIYPAHYRANTMFKLVFQAFIMLSLSSGYIIVRLTSEIRNQRSKIFNPYSIFLLFAFCFLLLVLSYPRLAINSYYGLDQKDDHGKLKKSIGLDGTIYLQKLYPADYAAIEWLNKNIKNQPVILEAQGDSYTDFARISSNTGLPTILGWTVHEWLWHNTYDVPAPRITDVKNLYETTDTMEAKRLLKKYKITYIYVGDMERQKYTGLSEEKFGKIGKAIYQNSSARIYKISY